VCPHAVLYQLLSPPGAEDEDGNILVTDSRSHRIRKLDLEARSVSTLAGTGVDGTTNGRCCPRDIARCCVCVCVRAVSALVVGVCVCVCVCVGVSVLSASFEEPQGIALNSRGDLFVVDSR
jgi:hypothetical protein